MLPFLAPTTSLEEFDKDPWREGGGGSLFWRGRENDEILIERCPLHSACSSISETYVNRQDGRLKLWSKQICAASLPYVYPHLPHVLLPIFSTPLFRSFIKSNPGGMPVIKECKLIFSKNTIVPGPFIFTKISLLSVFVEISASPTTKFSIQCVLPRAM